MPAKIRLQRFGKKGQAFYHIVIADGRAPRDGKFIEKIGTYNPLTKPADINLDFDRALYWLQCGAQPTDTTRAILSYKGVIYKNHLLKGVKKGALTEEQAEAKFQNWLNEKEAKIKSAANEHQQKIREADKKRIAGELKISEEKAKLIADKQIKEKLKLEEEAKEAEKAEKQDDAATQTEEVATTQAENVEENAVKAAEAPVTQAEAPVAKVENVQENIAKEENKVENTEGNTEEKTNE